MKLRDNNNLLIARYQNHLGESVYGLFSLVFKSMD